MPPSKQLPAADRARLNQLSRSERARLYQALVEHEVEVRITMTPNEREGLYQCLTKEYFNIDKQTGTFIDWLRSNSAPPTLLNVLPNLPKVPQSIKATHEHD
jgi:hypothetical protein